MKTNEIATINNVVIMATEGEKMIPIKPICEALGIAYEPQFTKLKEHDFLSSTVTLSVMVGADGKDREMVCLPYEFIFGWLFTINPKNVKPEAQEAVEKYQIECYKVLFAHFAEPQIFLAEQKKVTDDLLDQREKAKLNFRKADVILKDIEKNINVTRKMTIDEWRKANKQIEIQFTTE